MESSLTNSQSLSITEGIESVSGSQSGSGLLPKGSQRGSQSVSQSVSAIASQSQSQSLPQSHSQLLSIYPILISGKKLTTPCPLSWIIKVMTD